MIFTLRIVGVFKNTEAEECLSEALQKIKGAMMWFSISDTSSLPF